MRVEILASNEYGPSAARYTFDKPIDQAPMWWIEEGHVPSLEDAKARLDHLRLNGSTEFAFGWEAAPAAKLWQEKRCA